MGSTADDLGKALGRIDRNSCALDDRFAPGARYDPRSIPDVVDSSRAAGFRHDEYHLWRHPGRSHAAIEPMARGVQEVHALAIDGSIFRELRLRVRV